MGVQPIDPTEMIYPAETVAGLLNRATSSEASVIEAIAIAAGLYWRCRGCKRACPRSPYGSVDVCVKCYTARIP